MAARKFFHEGHTAKAQDTLKIDNTILALEKLHLDKQTIKLINYRLEELSQLSNLSDTSIIEDYIDRRKNQDGKESSNAYKNQLLKAYKKYTETNGINWKPKFYKVDRILPILPTKKSIETIITNANFRYSVIYTILVETGAEGKELETTDRKHIDEQQGIISIKGCKMHNGRAIKLKQRTTELLRQYLATYPEENPFPPSRYYGENWAKLKKRLAKRLNMPELLKTDVRHLRHFSGTEFYQTTKDILETKNRLGHKKIETTMLYTQLISFNQEEEYTVKVAQNIKEATDLIEHGFQYVTEMDNLKIFKKRK